MGGIYISHMRDEAGGVLDSVRETIEIGEKGGLPTQVTHHKVIGKANWGRSVDTLKLDRRGPRARRGRDHRSVSLHRVVDQHPGGADAGLGPRGRTRRGAEAPADAVDALGAAEGDGADHPRGARRRRSEQRAAGALRLGHVARRQAPRRGDERARPRADHRERRGDGAVDRREGRLRRHLPRDQRGGSAAHPPASGDDDRIRRRGADLRPGEPASAQLRHVRRACSAATCAS